MSNTARLIKEITVKDPDSGGDVQLEVYKHENGGIFAIDSSFVEQVLTERSENGETGYISIPDPFSDLDEPQELYLDED